MSQPVTALVNKCYFTPPDMRYPEDFMRVDPVQMSQKIAALNPEQHLDIFLIILEFCKNQDIPSFNMMINSLSNKKISLPYGLNVLPGGNGVMKKFVTEQDTFPPLLNLLLHNYFNLVTDPRLAIVSNS
jgi:hypothetical protein